LKWSVPIVRTFKLDHSSGAAQWSAAHFENNSKIVVADSRAMETLVLIENLSNMIGDTIYGY